AVFLNGAPLDVRHTARTGHVARMARLRLGDCPSQKRTQRDRADADAAAAYHHIEKPSAVPVQRPAAPGTPSHDRAYRQSERLDRSKTRLFWACGTVAVLPGR